MSCRRMRLEQAMYDVRYPDHSKPRVVITDESGNQIAVMRQLTGWWYRYDMDADAGDTSSWQFMGTDLESAAAAAVRAYQRENDREAVMV